MHELHSKDALYVLSSMCSAFVFNLDIPVTTNSTSTQSAKACGTKTYQSSSFKWSGLLNNKGTLVMQKLSAHLMAALQILLGVRLGRDVPTERRLPRQLYRLFGPYQCCSVSVWTGSFELAIGGSCAVEPFRRGTVRGRGSFQRWCVGLWLSEHTLIIRIVWANNGDAISRA